jgi:hypothetical protein
VPNERSLARLWLPTFARKSLRMKGGRGISSTREYQATKQNPEKPSRWGQLTREGHQVVQFKDVGTNRFVAVAVDGEVKVCRNDKSRRPH